MFPLTPQSLSNQNYYPDAPNESGFLSLEDGEEDEQGLPDTPFTYPEGGRLRPGQQTLFLPLQASDEDDVVSRLPKMWDDFHKAKQPNLERWKDTERMIKAVVSKTQNERFYAIAPLARQTVQVLISHFWNRSLATDKQLFTVYGEDERSKNKAPLYREYLLQQLKADNFAKKLDTALLLHYLPKGVVITHTGYKRSTELVEGAPHLIERWQPQNQALDEEPEDEEGQPQQVYSDPSQDTYQDTYTEETQLAELETYNGATTTVVDPHDFCFDSNQAENWDSCPKILRAYLVLEDLLEDPLNQNYEQLEELRELAKGKNSTRSKTYQQKQDRKAEERAFDDAGRIEVLEFHGDFRLKNGTYLRNWMLKVAGRKVLLRFEPNPCHINPFTKECYEETEDGWGISPIEYIKPLIEASSILLSAGVESAQQALNPAMLAPEGSFPKQKRIKVSQGKVIDYKPSMLNPSLTPTPIQSSTQAPFPYLALMEGQAEATTGATRQLSGNVTSNDGARTATEFQGLQVVGNLILDRLVDLFTQNLKLPAIKKFARIQAMTNSKPQRIAVEDEMGGMAYKTVTPEHHFSRYRFELNDLKTELERKQQLQEKLNFISMLRQDLEAGPRLKIIEIAKEYLNDMGFSNPGKYFKDDVQLLMDKATDVAIAQQVELMAQQMALKMQMMLQSNMQQLAQENPEAAMQLALANQPPNQPNPNQPQQPPSQEPSHTSSPEFQAQPPQGIVS